MYTNGSGIPIIDEDEIILRHVSTIIQLTITSYSESSNVALVVFDKHFDQCYVQDHTLH